MLIPKLCENARKARIDKGGKAMPKIPGYDSNSLGTKYTGGRGNFTRGDQRKGNMNGRSPLYPPGTPLGRVNLTVEMKYHAMLRAMGSGNATRGARMAVKLASQIMPLWMQDEQKVRETLDCEFDGKAKCREAVHEASKRLGVAMRPWEDPIKPGL